MSPGPGRRVRMLSDMSVRALPSTGAPEEGRRGPAPGRFADWANSRELITNLVRRDLKTRHRGTALGMVWSLVTPLLLVGLYTFIFTFILPTSPIKDSGDVPFAIYFFVALVAWNLFANGTVNAAGSIVGSGYLLKKVFFPREILPLTAVLSVLVTFAFEFAVAIAATVVFQGVPSWHIVYAPLILVVPLALAYGVGMLLAALTVFFRDIEHFLGIFMQLWFWGTPIIYSLAFVADKPVFTNILQANPMTGVVVSLRNVMLLGSPPDWLLLGYDALVAVVILVVAHVVFGRTKRLFPEMI